MLELLTQSTKLALLIIDSFVIINVCICVGNRMSKSTCNKVRYAYMIIFGADAFAIGMTIFVRIPTMLEIICLSGLAALFLFDRRNDYGNDNENGLSDMSLVKKNIKVQ